MIFYKSNRLRLRRGVQRPQDRAVKHFFLAFGTFIVVAVLFILGMVFG